jgi:hypothetical protein
VCVVPTNGDDEDDDEDDEGLYANDQRNENEMKVGRRGRGLTWRLGLGQRRYFEAHEGVHRGCRLRDYIGFFEGFRFVM